MHPGGTFGVLAGAATTVSPYVFGLGLVLGVPSPAWTDSSGGWLLLAGCMALTTGGLALRSRGLWDQWTITAGVVAVLITLVPRITANPALTLAILLLSVFLIFKVWEVDRPLPLRSRDLLPSDRDPAGIVARSAAFTAAAADVCLLLFFEPPPEAIRMTGFGIAILFMVRWCWARRHYGSKSSLALVGVVVGITGLALSGQPTAGHLLLAATAAVATRKDREVARKFVVPVIHRRVAPLVSSFFLLSLVGALILHAPGITTIEGGISSVDAFFTAVSAVCVTGLIVLDTATDFTFAGQGVILLLIQLGALGIMSYSAAVIIALGRRLSLGDEGAIASSLSGGDRGQLRAAIRRLIAFTFVSEALGSMVLAVLFYADGDGLAQALWRGVFTAVSAFCNAGFAIQSDSLIGYQQQALVLHVVGVLIVLGGLSPAAALAAPRVLAGREPSAQTKLIFAATGFLLGVNFIGFAVLEWNGSLGGLPVIDRLHNAWLQSVTLRTAGFNSVALEAVRPATLVVMMASMFIGGSPGGTAGGIKTTTAAVMVSSVVAAVRGEREITLFRRRVSRATIDRAGAIATLGVASLFLTVVVLLMTQAMPAAAAIFEAVSALATVGLSIGGTSGLDSVGKIVIMVAMFAGRVGPLSMFEFLATRETAPALQHPEESIDVG